MKKQTLTIANVTYYFACLSTLIALPTISLVIGNGIEMLALMLLCLIACLATGLWASADHN